MNATQKRLFDALEWASSFLHDDPNDEQDPEFANMLDEVRCALAAAKDEQDDPYRPRFRSAVSGLWYTKPKAAGDIDIVEVGGVKFFPPGEGEEQAKDEQSKVLTDEEIGRLADECFGNMLNGIKHRPLADLEQKAAKSTISMYRTALRYARDNGYLAPAKGSGLTVEGVMRMAVDMRAELIQRLSPATLRNQINDIIDALEDLAGKDNTDKG